ncbi:hypothetical protein Misp01_66560 [Microtetraspora sp. NBRC 13810]|uniref:hypothetical protein n=1 Tax=Microtetraspora sp. NBRC 13810 TaxID=3030990 RepID=UPI0024A5BF77|nr:hypothetical protein [Microtetraspora sp. NBRC 13810]GLW11528.1 hypothetical protein Misp01_66560 [Microtetraspora sp. NBRC 13810]
MRILGALALALALAGCGTAGGGADVASAGGGDRAGVSSPAPSLDQQEKGIRFAQCMRENGVDMPDPEPGKGITLQIDKSVSKETVEKAKAACAEFSPMGGSGANGPDPQRVESMRMFSQCMRDNGVEDFPDPEGAGLRMTETLAEDPDFRTAQEKCSKEFLPEAGQGGS